jgi:sporulation protein YlmC with PRC-barrel domain
MGHGVQSHSEHMSDVIGLSVVGSDNREIGDITDLLIERDSGRIRYAIVSYGGFIGIGKSLAVLPANQLRLDASRDRVRFHGDRQRLSELRLEGDVDDFLRNQARQEQMDARFRSAHRDGAEQHDLLSIAGDTASHEQQHYAAQRRDDQWGVAADQDQTAWGAGVYDAANEQTFRGTLEGTGMVAGDRLRMRTDDGRTLSVHIGSSSYLRQQGADLRGNEQITVIGSRRAATAQARVTEDDVIIARRIETRSGAFDIRDRQGNPMWQQAHEQHEQRKPDRTPPRVGSH